MSKITIDTIRQKEEELSKLKQELSKLRKQVPLEEVKDYEFRNASGSTTSLSNLFGNHDELIIVHNMGIGCSYCTLWADGFNGLVPHLENQAGFVVESMDPVDVQRKFAMDRGWRFTMVSSKGSSFRTDLGFASEDGPMPGASSFVKKNGKIYRVSSTFFGPGDNFCVLWDLMDLLPREQNYEDCGLEYFYSRPKMLYSTQKDDCCDP